MTTYILAGGGSGGHIYPGLAIAAELERLGTLQGRRVQTLMVCSDRSIDNQILTKAGAKFVAAPAKPIVVRPRGILRFLRSWGPSVRLGRRLISEHRSDDHNGTSSKVVLVAMGGFVAAPMAQAARAERIPTAMVNLDAVPGKANRWIAKRLRGKGPIFTAARVADRVLASEWIEVPPIVRAGARRSGTVEECRRRLGLNPSRPVLMVTGGSQGVRTINRFMAAFAGSPEAAAALKAGNWMVLHQTGKNEDAEASEAFRAAGIEARVQPFVDSMGDWWGAADLVIATAGAGNVAEVWSSKVPALFMPYPYHKDQHQRFNAQSLLDAGGAVVCQDHIDPALNLREVGPTLHELLSSPTRRESMRDALAKLGPADGATRIAERLLDLPKPTS